MKRILFFFIGLVSTTCIAQGKLTNASINIEADDRGIHINQHLFLNLPDSIQILELRALEFEGIELSINAIISENKSLSFKILKSNGLKLVEISSNEKLPKEVQISYTIQVEDGIFYLPVFFTNLPAATSENDFFMMTMTLKKQQEYLIHFPKVELTESIDNDLKKISLNLPALPSLIRMELPSNGNKPFEFTKLIDWTVALVFVIIGYFIWRNRKQLMYG